MDSIDLRILRALRSDGRLTWSALAALANLSASACQRRVEAMLRDRVIEKFTLEINQTALGNGVRALISVNVDRRQTKDADAFQRQLVEHPNVQACHMVSGAIDFVLDVVAKDLESLGSFIDDALLKMPAIKDASTSIVLRTIKPYTPAIGD